MRRIRLLSLIFCLILIFSSVGCFGFGGNGNGNGDGDDGDDDFTEIEFSDPDCDILVTEYNNINEITNINTYESEVSINGAGNNREVNNGVIISPYFTVKINDEEVEVYGTRTANGIHSFIYLDVVDTGEDGFNINVEIFGTENSTVFRPKKAKVTVLPESHNIETSLNRDGKEVRAVIDKTGSFSFVFNETYAQPLTIVVKEPIDTATLFNGYSVQEVPVGDYSKSNTYQSTLFTNQNTVYKFSKGRYLIDKIQVPSNSIIYLERGAYLELKPSTTGSNTNGIYAYQKNNIKVVGRGLIDYSACCGSSLDGSYSANKGGLSFNGCDGITFSGITVINSMTWTLTFESCKNVQVDDLMFFAYRMYADGVMLSNCVNGIIEDSFIRTGDDAFETKSSGPSSQKTDNILFQNNDAWTDKAVAYGCIYECYNDTRNVTFKNCSVGFANGSWSPHLGCLVIQLGQEFNPGRITENITFENIEIYYSVNQAILNCYIGGTGGSGDGAGIIQNIYFKNITAKYNMGKVLNVQTYDNENCFINDLYLDNVYSNGTLITKDNIEVHIRDKVVGGYDINKLHINTKN